MSNPTTLPTTTLAADVTSYPGRGRALFMFSIVKVLCVTLWPNSRDRTADSWAAEVRRAGRCTRGSTRGCWLCSASMAWLILGLCLTACNPPRQVSVLQAIAGQTMGTTYSVKLGPSVNSADLSQAATEIERELESVNAQMSTYLTTSELSRFNQQSTDDWFPVSVQTAEVVELSLQLSQQSDGAFDVTIGPLVDLWGFGATGRHARVPSEAAIRQALQSVGADKLQVRLSPPALRKTQPDLHVDLSAIAKGHGVDRVAAVLERLQFTSYFVEIGGEVRTKGKKPSGQAWHVGVELPSSSERSIERVLAVTDQALATSGNYRNYFELDGRRYSHTIDPKTGWPTEDSIVSASVLADNCALADGIATAMMSAGFDEGLAMAERQGWAVMLERSTSDGGLETRQSTVFGQRAELVE